MRRQRARELLEPCRGNSICLEHIVVAKQIEYSQRGSTGERVTGVGMRVQKSSREIVVVERLVNFVAGQHHRQR